MLIKEPQYKILGKKRNPTATDENDFSNFQKPGLGNQVSNFGTIYITQGETTRMETKVRWAATERTVI